MSLVTTLVPFKKKIFNQLIIINQRLIIFIEFQVHWNIKKQVKFTYCLNTKKKKNEFKCFMKIYLSLSINKNITRSISRNKE